MVRNQAQEEKDAYGNQQNPYDLVFQFFLNGILDHYFPSGAYFHAAAQGANGWRVIDCWRSPADFEAFGSQLIPVITELGFKPLGQDVSDVINLLSR